jgi:hypothetical protein
MQDRTPDIECMVIIYSESKDRISIATFCHGELPKGKEWIWPKDVTHWMNLPPKPEKKQQ